MVIIYLRYCLNQAIIDTFDQNNLLFDQNKSNVFNSTPRLRHYDAKHAIQCQYKRGLNMSRLSTVNKCTKLKKMSF